MIMLLLMMSGFKKLEVFRWVERMLIIVDKFLWFFFMKVLLMCFLVLHIMIKVIWIFALYDEERRWRKVQKSRVDGSLLNTIDQQSSG